ncbi:MAG: V-type ATPase 116kDa subunit family protein, partial [Candidatus Nanohaloarchaea archaeon]
IVEPVSKLWIFLGAIYVITVSIQKYGTKIMQWNKFLVIAILLPPILLLTFSQVIEEWDEVKGIKHLLSQIEEGGFESFHSILSFLSNTFSYSRLSALALVHVGLFIALGKISNKLAGMINLSVIDTILWILVYSIGTILILALDGLIVFLHSLRLHYYEMFDKFFKRGSKSFNPFKSK